jgi:multidrug resistance efflux pump
VAPHALVADTIAQVEAAAAAARKQVESASAHTRESAAALAHTSAEIAMRFGKLDAFEAEWKPVRATPLNGALGRPPCARARACVCVFVCVCVCVYVCVCERARARARI